MREAAILTRLGDRFDIDLVAVTPRFDRDADHLDEAATCLRSVTLLEAVPVRDRSMPARVALYQCPHLEPWLRAAFDRGLYRAMHVEGYFLLAQMPRDLDVPIVLVEENVEYLLETDTSADGKFRRALARRMEIGAWRRASVCGAVGSQDLAAMRAECPNLTFDFFPMGFDHLATEPRAELREQGTDVLFVGNYSWQPTLEATMALLDEVWPRVIAATPKARLTLVGSGMDTRVRSRVESVPGTHTTGTVRSVAPYLATTDVFICPVATSTGIKVKLAEALVAGCPIVTHPAAISGLPRGIASAVVTADTADEMAEAVTELLADPLRRSTLSCRAQSFAARLPTWDEAAGAVADAWERAWLAPTATEAIRATAR